VAAAIRLPGDVKYETELTALAAAADRVEKALTRGARQTLQKKT
jgi:hypothetical protein